MKITALVTETFVTAAFVGVVLICVLIAIASSGAHDPVTESVLPNETTLRVHDGEGLFSVTAVSPTVRTFTWPHGRVATVTLISRGTTTRWQGSFGLYHPSAELRGTNWSEIGVFEEAQAHFSRQSEAIKWLARGRAFHGSSTFLWTHDGIAVFMHEEQSPRVAADRVLQVDVWQLCINGQRPSMLPNASDNAIHLLDGDGRPAQTSPCTNPGPLDDPH
jgi:hypothetical protein